LVQQGGKPELENPRTFPNRHQTGEVTVKRNCFITRAKLLHSSRLDFSICRIAGGRIFRVGTVGAIMDGRSAISMMSKTNWFWHQNTAVTAARRSAFARRSKARSRLFRHTGRRTISHSIMAVDSLRPMKAAHLLHFMDRGTERLFRSRATTWCFSRLQMERPQANT